jgi:hypothetical protein
MPRHRLVTGLSDGALRALERAGTGRAEWSHDRSARVATKAHELATATATLPPPVRPGRARPPAHDARTPANDVRPAAGTADQRAVAVTGLRCSVAWHAAGQIDMAVTTLRRVLPIALAGTAPELAEAADALEAHAAIARRTRPELAAGLLGAASKLRAAAGPPRPGTAAGPGAAVAARAAGMSAEMLGARRYARWFRAGGRLGLDGLLDLCAQLGHPAPVD